MFIDRDLNNGARKIKIQDITINHFITAHSSSFLYFLFEFVIVSHPFHCKLNIVKVDRWVFTDDNRPESPNNIAKHHSYWHFLAYFTRFCLNDLVKFLFTYQFHVFVEVFLFCGAVTFYKFFLLSLFLGSPRNDSKKGWLRDIVVVLCLSEIIPNIMGSIVESRILVVNENCSFLFQREQNVIS